VARKGVVIDINVQMVSRTDEIQLADVRGFILRLKTIGFNIMFATYDGYESLESTQLLRTAGIDAFIASVDRDNNAYETWKELMYQQLAQTYNNPIAVREAKELVMSSAGKVDHPDVSYEREQSEGKNKGSKDVMDSIVGVTRLAYEKLNIDPGVFFG
jgi:hypothetical protein